MRPEENLAKRLVWRHSLSPRIDVMHLASLYATVEVCRFPVDVDGVSLFLKNKQRRPHILVSEALSPRRQRFTLAHELGHVLIPWHLGSIVDETDLINSIERSTYWDLEGEANRFASELLIPTDWMQSIVASTSDAAASTRIVVESADVSIQAATVKLLNSLPAGYVFARVHAGEVTWSGNSIGTLASRVPYGPVDVDSLFPAAEQHSWAAGSDGYYHWWQLKDALPLPDIEEGDDWRLLLQQILDDIPLFDPNKLRSSIHGVIAAANGSVRENRSTERIYAVCLNRLEGRANDASGIQQVIKHALFSRFLVAKVRDFRV
ncbi:ImmA/IrrE family metallo-endopeptidase [Sphingomonas echinoides]|uniref:ImmA/IrrE family metallo-endopeptidase n=1 Tax=Sphingomonas echinoides TaxID=59803 RepID=UPI0024135EEC|nr:ImmA/IrrE family metallo-endopeptidase [Sphingomonas echinoides]